MAATVGEAAMSTATRAPKFGRKQLFLPHFTITLLRTPFLPPNYASFIVPLNLNKLDLKDYLYHAYSVRVFSVRSYVQQQRVRQDKPDAKVPMPRRWFRPRSIKKMTVEMDSPFVWPAEPDDYSPWDRDRYLELQKEQDAEREAQRPDTPKTTPETKSIAEQAKRLLTQDEKWKPQWEDVGEPTEVETDVTVPRR